VPRRFTRRAVLRGRPALFSGQPRRIHRVLSRDAGTSIGICWIDMVISAGGRRKTPLIELDNIPAGRINSW
jgi:hypothetical protein